MAKLALDGSSLTLEQLVQAARDPETEVSLSPEAIPGIQRAADAVAKYIREGRIAYGITTGFGAFKDRLIPPADVEKLQENIILSHAVGTGPELPAEVVRAMMIIRANTLAKGHPVSARPSNCARPAQRNILPSSVRVARRQRRPCAPRPHGSAAHRSGIGAFPWRSSTFSGGAGRIRHEAGQIRRKGRACPH